MAPDAANSDITAKQKSKAASRTGMNMTVTADMRWAKGRAGWVGKKRE